MIRRPTIAIAVAALVAIGGCGNEPEQSRASDTSSTTANLLDSRVDPGLGTGATVPFAGSNGGMSQLPGSAAPGAPTGRARQEIDIQDLGYNSGDPDALVRIVEFSDFGCGYCRQFHMESYPLLEQEYMASGKVEWKYIPIIIGLFKNALPAAETGECAGEQGMFPRMRDRLFESQPEWKNADEPMPMMYRYAQEEGLDMTRFRNCVEQGWQRERIAAGTQLSQQANVRGTPTFYVVGYAPIPGALPLEMFRQVLDTVYAEALAAPGGGQ